MKKNTIVHYCKVIFMACGLWLRDQCMTTLVQCTDYIFVPILQILFNISGYISTSKPKSSEVSLWNHVLNVQGNIQSYTNYLNTVYLLGISLYDNLMVLSNLERICKLLFPLFYPFVNIFYLRTLYLVISSMCQEFTYP